MARLENQTAKPKFDIDDRKWAKKFVAGENRLLEMIATFGGDIVVNAMPTHPMVVTLTPA
jgi:hypothetical protein